MAKIKLTKNELKRQKDLLRRYKRYLPTLQLKKQQLQMELRKVDDALQTRRAEISAIRARMVEWIGVLAEEVGLSNLVAIDRVEKSQSNIAGVDIPVFRSVHFKTVEYDLFTAPLWVDTAIARIRDLLRMQIEATILQEQSDILRAELTVTSQRVNLFEKVKIPQTQEHIRVIQIYLGDQQTAAVVRGKISKAKIIEKAGMADVTEEGGAQ